MGGQGLQLNQLPLEQLGSGQDHWFLFDRGGSGRCRKQKKQLRLLLCQLWKAMRPSCMLPSWLLHSAVVLLPWAAFPKRVGLLYAVLYFEKKDVMFSIATIAIYKLLLFKKCVFINNCKL